MATLLSVIVPLYNTASYMDSCIESILHQDVKDLQVILVNDGSPDDSEAIAVEWCERDQRVTLVSQENRGLSQARNRGLHTASGRYLAFCDADDVVPDGAYKSLIDSLESSGSDFATGDVRRFNQDGFWKHGGYGDVFSSSRPGEHLSTFPDLVRDRMVWNKIFRRSFWDRHGLRFSLPMYEDAPVMIEAHIRARAVDVLSDIVYHWRVRDRGPLSTTQDRNNPDNAAGFMAMVLETFKVIRSLQPSVMPEYIHVMCIGDVADLLQILRENDPSEFVVARKIAMEFILDIPSQVRERLPVESQEIIADLLLWEANHSTPVKRQR